MYVFDACGVATEVGSGVAAVGTGIDVTDGYAEFIADPANREYR